MPNNARKEDRLKHCKQDARLISPASFLHETSSRSELDDVHSTSALIFRTVREGKSPRRPVNPSAKIGLSSILHSQRCGEIEMVNLRNKRCVHVVDSQELRASLEKCGKANEVNGNLATIFTHVFPETSLIPH